MVLQERQPTLEEVQAEWMAALERALDGSDEEWAEFITMANRARPFTPEEDAEDIAFVQEYEARRELGKVDPSVLWDDEHDRIHDPELYEFFQRLDQEFPENDEMWLDRKLPTSAGADFMRRLRNEFPQALHLYMMAMPTEDL